MKITQRAYGGAIHLPQMMALAHPILLTTYMLSINPIALVRGHSMSRPTLNFG